jgi:hypothetical protein
VGDTHSLINLKVIQTITGFTIKKQHNRGFLMPLLCFLQRYLAGGAGAGAGAGSGAGAGAGGTGSGAGAGGGAGGGSTGCGQPAKKVNANKSIIENITAKTFFIVYFTSFRVFIVNCPEHIFRQLYQ